MSDALLDLLLRVIGILLLAALTAGALRRHTASLRALVWTVALGGALAMPALAFVSPRLDVAILPAIARTVAEPGPVAAPGARVAPGAPSTPSTRSTAEAGSPSPSQSLSPVLEPEATAPGVRQLAHGNDAPEPASIVRVDFTLLLLGAWMIAALTLLARLVLGHVRLGRIVRRSVPADAAWRALVDDVRSRLGVRRAVDVRRSHEIDVPAVAGVFSPVLLLPAEDGWSATERRDVALHELAHVARWDGLSQLVSSAACAIYWFIPLTWYAARQAAALREQACDNVVLGAGTRASAYAERLIAFATSTRAASLEPVALAMARPARLHGRLLGLLDPRVRRTRLGLRSTATALALAFALIGSAAVVTPVAAEAAQVTMPDATPDATPDAAAAPAAGTPPVTASAPAIDASPRREAQQRARRLICEDAQSRSINRNSNDDGESWQLTVKGPRCDVSIRIDGKPTFNAAFTDVTNITGRGRFELDVTQDGVRRELSLRDEGDRITRTWRVDGRERPYDDAAAAWFGGFLVELDRQTAFAVDARLPLLLERGGVGAVLEETALMPSDYARATYYKALSAARRLSAADLRRMLDQEARLDPSDFYAAELLKGIAKQDLRDATVRDGVMRLITAMESDFYKAESIKATISAGPASTDEVQLLMRAVGAMESDFYKSETVKLLLRTSDLTPDQLGDALSIIGGMKSDFHIGEILGGLAKREALAPAERRAYLDATRRMESDFYRSEALKGLLAKGAPSAAERDQFTQAVVEMESDHYQGEVLRRLLEHRTLTEADLLGVERAARAIGSDHTHAEVLRRIVSHAGATAAVNDAVYSASEGLSRHYRDELRRLVGR